MTTKSCNILTRADSFKLYDYFKEHKDLIAQMSFKELVDFARICIPNVSEWSVRDYTQNHGIVYNQKKFGPTARAGTTQLNRIEEKLDTILAQQQMILDAYTAPK